MARRQAKRKRDSAAVVDLYNAIVDLPEPNELTQEAVKVCMCMCCVWA